MTTLRSYLRRYWFRFDPDTDGLPPGAVLGYGVTAVDRFDAEALLRQTVFGGEPLPTPIDVTENVDVGDLDAGHVLPNMSDPSVRGIWFPRL